VAESGSESGTNDDNDETNHGGPFRCHVLGVGLR
jgi:hypothetical protein